MDNKKTTKELADGWARLGNGCKQAKTGENPKPVDFMDIFSGLADPK